ncbi:MAG: SEFIR domain-containing protein, partial [Euzebya sp.]
MSDTIRGFISYSHDSPEHEGRVLALSERLRKDGIDVSLDQYVNGTPAGGWQRWMLNELDAAAFVLLVCTETYYRRFRGHEEPRKGKGADWEGVLITQEIYDSRSRTVKFVPVLFDPAHERFIPEPLRSVTHYTLTSEPSYEALYDFLLGQAGVEPGALGDIRRKDRKRAAPLTFPADPPSRERQSDGSAQQIAPSRLRHSAERLIGREAELARLDAAWADPTTNVLTIVAFGGEGKTSLVAHWQARLAQRGFDGAWYFDWSFYSQGTREEGGASADAFVKAALEFFGDSEMAGSAASPWDKGARLAHLVAQRKTLLVLDGLEPLQYPPSAPLPGELREPAVAALLKGLAQRNSGLCVVTTREHVSDIGRFRETTAPELELLRLSTPAGVDLLGTVGVKGSEKELEALVEDVRGHALTLNLIGRY